MKNDEKFVQELLEKHFGMKFQKIPETTTKTPDFEFRVDGERILVAELKTLREAYLDDPSWKVFNDSEDISEYVKSDNAVNKVSRLIRDAAKQLSGFAGLKMIIFHSLGLADASDLLNCINGYFEMSYLNKTIRISSDDRQHLNYKKIFDEIDIYIWISEPRGWHIDAKDLSLVEDNNHEFCIFPRTREGIEFSRKYLQTAVQS